AARFNGFSAEQSNAKSSHLYLLRRAKTTTTQDKTANTRDFRSPRDPIGGHFSKQTRVPIDAVIHLGGDPATSNQLNLETAVGGHDADRRSYPGRSRAIP